MLLSQKKLLEIVRASAVCMSLVGMMAVPCVVSAASSVDAVGAAKKSLIQYLVSDSASEIQLSRLAQQVSHNRAVLAFASRMIAEHQSMIAEATALAKSADISDIEVKPSDEGVIEYAHALTYRGHQFDEEYVRANIMDHHDDADVLRHASEVMKDSATAEFIQQTQMRIEQHEMLAERTADQVALEH